MLELGHLLRESSRPLPLSISLRPITLAPLHDGCVHLYGARVDEPPLPRGELEDLLSADERERAARFRFDRDRRRSVAAWGLLRATLGLLVGRDPASLRFVRGGFGKPRLAEGPSFNLSHSGDWMMIAVAVGGRLGVDVEMVWPLTELGVLADRNFSPDEAAALRALPAEDRERAFFRTWTRKEAFLKALGGGLSIPLDSFSVSLAPHSTHALLRVNHPGEEPEGWSLFSVPCGGGGEAAVAWDRPGGQVRPLDPGFGARLGPAHCLVGPVLLRGPLP